jgi:hypothetical protein
MKAKRVIVNRTYAFEKEHLAWRRIAACGLSKVCKDFGPGGGAYESLVSCGLLAKMLLYITYWFQYSNCLHFFISMTLVFLYFLLGNLV